MNMIDKITYFDKLKLIVRTNLNSMKFRTLTEILNFR